MSRRLSVTATYDMFGVLCDAFLGHFGLVRRGLWLSSSGLARCGTDPESLRAFGLELHLARSPVRLDVVVDLALQLAWRRGRLAIAASMALWSPRRCSLPANLAQQLAWCRDWPLPQLARRGSWCRSWRGNWAQSICVRVSPSRVVASIIGALPSSVKEKCK